ncbi:hypothetical protein CRUP_009190 [Coryphaenoides rupestris]|nr:hypothetical protein CRUP_009190 [Coryphaenoides rupestris]
MTLLSLPLKTDSPEEMRGWIRDIEGKILDFRGHAKGGLLKRGSSLYHGQHGEDSRPQLLKSCSVAPGWQPWTPVPQREAPAALDTDEGPFRSLAAMPSLSCSSTSSSSSSSNSLSAPTPCPCPGPGPGPANPVGRRRHRSQPASSRIFPFSLDEDGIRTTDV